MEQRPKKKPELLMPAGSLEVLKTAFNFGADAVYLGGDMYGLRAKAKNFSYEDMREGIAFAHEHDVKVYVTIGGSETLAGLTQIHFDRQTGGLMPQPNGQYVSQLRITNGKRSVTLKISKLTGKVTY